MEVEVPQAVPVEAAVVEVPQVVQGAVEVLQVAGFYCNVKNEILKWKYFIISSKFGHCKISLSIAHATFHSRSESGCVGNTADLLVTVLSSFAVSMGHFHIFKTMQRYFAHFHAFSCNAFIC